MPTMPIPMPIEPLRVIVSSSVSLITSTVASLPGISEAQ
jgi:hypothetical protein